MRASEVIQELQKLINTVGDLEVVIGQCYISEIVEITHETVYYPQYIIIDGE